MSKHQIYCQNCQKYYLLDSKEETDQFQCPKCHYTIKLNTVKEIPDTQPDNTQEELEEKTDDAHAEETFTEINVGENSGNAVAQVLRSIAWISLILVIVAVAMLFSQEGGIAALTVLFGGGLEVTLLFAASEALNLLQGIKNNMEEK